MPCSISTTTNFPPLQYTIWSFQRSSFIHLHLAGSANSLDPTLSVCHLFNSTSLRPTPGASRISTMALQSPPGARPVPIMPLTRPSRAKSPT